MNNSVLTSHKYKFPLLFCSIFSPLLSRKRLFFSLSLSPLAARRSPPTHSLSLSLSTFSRPLLTPTLLLLAFSSLTSPPLSLSSLSSLSHSLSLLWRLQFYS